MNLVCWLVLHVLLGLGVPESLVSDRSIGMPVILCFIVTSDFCSLVFYVCSDNEMITILFLLHHMQGYRDQ